ncbi:MAG: hypothetical protein VXZ58_02695, partial [Actinomycetota bacterium]|nr:hypothetical protein [Actinomycetota bacterium]
MEENDDGKEPPPLIPRVIYQSVNLDLHLDKEGIDCETELLLVFPRKELKEGSIFYLHCRVPIDKVLINSIPAEFDLRDPLRCIHYDEDRRKNFVGKEADLNFRSALEISTQGELQLRIPNGFEAHRKSIDPLPMVPGDNPPLAAVFDSLNEVISAALDGKKQNLDN